MNPMKGNPMGGGNPMARNSKKSTERVCAHLEQAGPAWSLEDSTLTDRLTRTITALYAHGRHDEYTRILDLKKIRCWLLYIM